MSSSSPHEHIQNHSRFAHPIAALATSGGVSAVSVVRLSGEGCHALLFPLLRFMSSHIALDTLRTYSRQMLRMHIMDPERAEALDDGLVVFFFGPHSYTGEDAAELFLHGGPYLGQQCLKILWSHGFSPALAGEFTQRAFLHGKLDLITAEGIREITQAQTQAQWMAARNLISGTLKQYVSAVREELIAARVLLEALMDFPDEQEGQDISTAQVAKKVEAAQAALKTLSTSYHSGTIARRGYRVLFLGRPNAGKSTLMNALCGTTRSIVTAEQGTTRDYIEETVVLDGRAFCLIDTAGIRPAEEITSEAEKHAVDKTWELIGSADLVCQVVCCQDPHPWDYRPQIEIAPHPSRTPSLRLISQCDRLASAESGPAWRQPEDMMIAVGAHNTQARDASKQALIKKLCTYVDAHTQPLKGQPFICTARHKNAITQAEDAIARFFSDQHAGAYEEILASHLWQACHHLADIIGEVASDDILDGVFTNFCMGK